MVEIESNDVCQPGSGPEPELQYKTDKEAAQVPSVKGIFSVRFNPVKWVSSYIGTHYHCREEAREFS